MIELDIPRELQTKEMLFGMLEKHHPITAEHSKRVSFYTAQMADFAGYCPSEVEEIQNAVLFHDIGKIDVPLEILNKQVTRTPQELAICKMHPEFGMKLVKECGVGSLAETIAIQHHERFNGTGYPYGLSGDEIDPVSHIVAYMDSFDAATTRVWNGEKKSPEEVYREIMNMVGNDYHPQLLDPFEEFYQWYMWKQ